jgi:hypothetical protein
MTDTLQAIISKSTTAPLIILQSDHGPASLLGHPFKWERPPDIAGVKERMSILFAYHTPENEELYPPTITPVNVFRLLFNHYFNANYDTLPNYNYFSDNNRPFQFVDVTEDIVSGYGAL